MPGRTWEPTLRTEAATWLVENSSEENTVGGVVTEYFDAYARLSTLPTKRQIALLGQILTGNTTTPESCWFAVWKGFSLQAAALPGSAALVIDGNPYFLYHGSVSDLEDLSEYLATAALPRKHATAARAQGAVYVPSRWWPQDRAWLAGWHIDGGYLVMGGSSKLVSDLLGTPELMATRTRSDALIEFDLDSSP